MDDVTESEWCPASGSDDEYWADDRADQVQCHECERYLYLTTGLRLPRHKTKEPTR